MGYKKFLLVLFSLVLLFVLPLQIVLADSPAATWYGNAYIGSNTSTTGANVSAWVNGIPVESFIVGVDFCGSDCTAPTYMADVPCSQGDSVTLNIYNVTNSSQTCNPGTRTLLNLTISTLADSTACSWSEDCSGGYCCAGINEYRGNGTGACQATACTSNVTAPTPAAAPPTGGGGGGTPSGEESQTKYTGFIDKGETKGVTYSKEDTLKVTSIEVTTTEQVKNAAIKVAESSESKAGYAIAADEGGAYKYLKITKSLVSDEQIESAKIYFKVEKSWYTDNDYDPVTTEMRRKVDDTWQDLTTAKYKEDGDYYYFYADTPALSYFAITAKKTGYVPPVEEAICGDGKCEGNETCSTCPADCACGIDEECVDDVCEKKEVVEEEEEEKPVIIGISKAVWVWIGVGIALLAIIIIALAIKKKKFKKEQIKRAKTK